MPLPNKKVLPPGPFLKGQLGHMFFSLSSIHNFMEMPHRYSLIVQSFCQPYSFECVKTEYVITNLLRNKWMSPEMFNQWRCCVENEELSELDMKLYLVAIMWYVNEFKLCSFLHKTKHIKINSFLLSLLLMRRYPMLTLKTNMRKRTQTSNLIWIKNNYYCR